MLWFKELVSINLLVQIKIVYLVINRILNPVNPVIEHEIRSSPNGSDITSCNKQVVYFLKEKSLYHFYCFDIRVGHFLFCVICRFIVFILDMVL